MKHSVQCMTCGCVGRVGRTIQGKVRWPCEKKLRVSCVNEIPARCLAGG